MSSRNPVRQTLYLKYRPQRFAELVGQEVIARTLRNAVREGRLGHAYLFTGIRGTGKTSAARILARAYNCLEPEDGEPCGRCQACTEIQEQRSLDVIEIDAATNRGIDEIRELRERAQFLPSQLRCKVYIIDEAHMLTKDASNAFLKTLEEPPEHACFILATTEPHNVVDTILSRCQRYDFRLISEPAVEQHLARICEQEGVRATGEALALVADAARGSLRDALSLLDRLIGLGGPELNLEAAQAGLGLADPTRLAALAQNLVRGDLGQAWRELAQLQAAGVEPRQLARSLGALAKERLWAELGTGGVPSPESGFWLQLMALASQAGGELRRADDPWMTLEASLLRLAQPQPEGGSGPLPLPSADARSEPARALPQAAPGSQVKGDPLSPGHPRQGEEGPAAGGPGVRRWAEILAWVASEDIPVHALLRDGSAASHENGVLTVEFDSSRSFLLQRMQQPRPREVLRLACQAVLGEEVTLVLRAAETKAPGEAPNRPAAETEPPDPGVAKALQIFPGSRVIKDNQG